MRYFSEAGILEYAYQSLWKYQVRMSKLAVSLSGTHLQMGDSFQRTSSAIYCTIYSITAL